MIGAVAGDMIGSVFEWSEEKPTSFPLFSPQSRFTDDTVLSVAVAETLLRGTGYEETLRKYYHAYPDAGYGRKFSDWARTPGGGPYNSWGNGSAMRVSPVGFAGNDLEQVLREAARSARVTHNHPEGIKGAQAVAAAVFLAKSGADKAEIREYIQETFHYDLGQTVAELQAEYAYDVSCQGSVPQAITVFLEAGSFEDGIYKAVSIGGDSDTICCMAGAMLQAYYRAIPPGIVKRVYDLLDSPLAAVVREFGEKFCQGML